MLDVKFENENVILKFPKQAVTLEYFQNFLERIKLELIARNSTLTEEQSWELSEEIKQRWWSENKNKFIEK